MTPDRDPDSLRARLEERGAIGVVGAAGVGKTWLLRAVADGWRGDVLWLDLGADGDPDAVRERVGRAIGLDTWSDAAIAYGIGPRLVVFDHGDLASAFLGDLVRVWRAAGVGARFVVGSRIRQAGIEPWPVGPLADDDAVAWFRARWIETHGTADGPEEPTIRRIAARLAGNPRSIALAVAWYRLYPPDVLADRVLDPDGPIGEAVQGSWRCLSERDRAALAACSVFVGPFDADDFRAVADRPPDALAALLDASLIRATEAGRVRVEPGVRAFAARAVSELAPGAPARHAAWVPERGGRALVTARTTGDWTALEALREDLLALAAGEGEAALNAAILLAELALGLGTPGDPLVRWPSPPPALAVRVAVLRAKIHGSRGDPAACLAVLEGVTPATPADRYLVHYLRAVASVQLDRLDAAAAALEAMGDGDGRPAATLVAEAELRCLVYSRRGDQEAALRGLEAARVRLVGQDPDRTWAARLDLAMGIQVALTSPERALALFERAGAAFAAAGQTRAQAEATRYLAETHHDLGNLQAAVSEAETAVALAVAAGDRKAEIRAHLVVVGVNVDQRRLDEAESRLDRACALAADPAVPPTLRAFRALLHQLRGRTAEARATFDAALSGPWSTYVRASTFHWWVFAALLREERAGATFDALDVEAGQVGPTARLLVRMGREVLAGGLTDATRMQAAATPQSVVRLMRILAEPGLRVGADGSWLARGHLRVDLRSRPVLRRLLAVLASAGPGGMVGREALLAAVWPDHRVRNASLDARLHVAVNTLRRLGLGAELLTGNTDGLAYGLGPGTSVEDGV